MGVAWRARRVWLRAPGQPPNGSAASSVSFRWVRILSGASRHLSVENRLPRVIHGGRAFGGLHSQLPWHLDGLRVGIVSAICGVFCRYRRSLQLCYEVIRLISGSMFGDAVSLEGVWFVRDLTPHAANSPCWMVEAKNR